MHKGIGEKKAHQDSNEADRGTDIAPDDPDTHVFVSDAINDEDSCHLDTITWKYVMPLMMKIVAV